jgi:hypothetical protein
MSPSLINQAAQFVMELDRNAQRFDCRDARDFLDRNCAIWRRIREAGESVEDAVLSLLKARLHATGKAA